MQTRSRRTLFSAGIVTLGALLTLWAAQAISAQAQQPLQDADSGKSAPGAGVPSACGPAFVIQQTANHATDGDWLEAISAVSSTDMWAVGSIGAQQTLIEHWDGTSWTIVSSPNPGASINELYAVRGTANNMWAVGDFTDASSHQKTLIEHWDGTSWSWVGSASPGTTVNILSSVAVGSATNAWAVGGYVDANGSHTLIEHWNGSIWSTSPSPSPGSASNVLQAVRIVSTNNVWAVGHYYLGSAWYTLAEQWDGSTWNVRTSPNQGTGSNDLLGLAVISASDIWAVGNYQNGARTSTLTEHWDGSAWSIASSADVPAYNNQLLSVSANSTNDVWAVGYSYAASPRPQTLTEHWDGSTWSIVPSANPATSFNEVVLYGVAAISSTEVVAVGYYEHEITEQTLAETLNPCLVTPTPTVCAIQYSDVPSGTEFYPYVHCLACMGIISGYADGTFKPNADISRGQLSKIVSNAAGFDEAQPNQMFQDVPVGSTFQVYIGRLAHRYYIGGYPCGGVGEQCVPPGNLPYFRPNANATRGQIAKIDSNAAFFFNNPSGQQFQDVPVGSTYYTYTYRLVAFEIMGGYPCGGTGEPCGPSHLPYFRPNVNATRAQTAKIVSNTFFPDCDIP